MMDSEEEERIDKTDGDLSSEWFVVDAPAERDNQEENPCSFSCVDQVDKEAVTELPALAESAMSLQDSCTSASPSNKETTKLKKEYVVIPPKKPKLSKAERRAKQEAQRAAKGLNSDGSKKWDRKADLKIMATRDIGGGAWSSPSSHLMGAIIGDIAGSRFETSPLKNPQGIDLISPRCRFTDDTVLTLAVADALIHKKPYDQALRYWAKKYPGAGYGFSFRKWIHDETMGAYNSWGNGSAMRVSPCGYLPTLELVLKEAKASAECTHNHKEGIKGAQATAACIFMARNGKSKEEIRKYVTDTFGYDLERTIESIRPTYRFDSSCQGSVPEAIIAFLDGKNFRDTILLAISLGGDADTQGAIAGSIAQAYYKKIPMRLESRAKEKLNDDMIEIIDEFNAYIDAEAYC